MSTERSQGRNWTGLSRWKGRSCSAIIGIYDPGGSTGTVFGAMATARAKGSINKQMETKEWQQGQEVGEQWLLLLSLCRDRNDLQEPKLQPGQGAGLALAQSFIFCLFSVYLPPLWELQGGGRADTSTPTPRQVLLGASGLQILSLQPGTGAGGGTGAGTGAGEGEGVGEGAGAGAGAGAAGGTGSRRRNRN